MWGVAAGVLSRPPEHDGAECGADRGSSAGERADARVAPAGTGWGGAAELRRRRAGAGEAWELEAVEGDVEGAVRAGGGQLEHQRADQDQEQ